MDSANIAFLLVGSRLATHKKAYASGQVASFTANQSERAQKCQVNFKARLSRQVRYPENFSKGRSGWGGKLFVRAAS